MENFDHGNSNSKKPTIHSIYIEGRWLLLTILPANAISGRSGGGNDEEIFAAAKNSNLFLNACKVIKLTRLRTQCKIQ